MITLLLWSIIGLLVGVLLVTVVPWVAARLAGPEWVEKVSSFYIWLAQSSINKSALIIRPGAVDLVPKKFDTDQKADKDTAGGEPRHHRDSLNTLSHLANKPFGVTLHDTDEYLSPLLADIGAKAKELTDREEIGAKMRDGKRVMLDGIPMSERAEFVDLTAAKHVVSGDADPEAGHRSYKKTVISQEKFHERMTFGQTVMLLAAAFGSMALAWLLATRDAPSTGTSISMLLLLAAPLADEELRGKLTMAAVAVMSVLVIPVIALLSGGLLAAILVLVLSLAVGIGWPLSIALFGPSLPSMIGAPLARIHWTLGQLCVGRGVLVERDTGHYEHHQLRAGREELDEDYYCVLNNGEELPIDGSEADLIRFGWAPLGLTVQKTQENMQSITHTPQKLLSDGGDLEAIQPDNTRQNYQPEFRAEALTSDWLVTLPQLAQWCRGSAESESIREGRDTALTEQGGQQQIGYVIYIVLILLAIVIGGLMGLLAGGALI